MGRMGLVVQKFGGTSVADAECIKRVARRVVARKRAGDDVVVVVSARGDTTDELVELAYEITDRPSEREFDVLLSTGEQISIALLAMAIHAEGEDAVSFTGPQIRIITDSAFGKARIRSIDTSRILEALGRKHVVIVAGFQGMDSSGDITTLGRGGSDTTAVALAAVLGCPCEIYTDVDGVYTADPRIVKEAVKLNRLSYDEMLEMASMGAKVLQHRSVEFAKKYSVPLQVRSTFTEEEGTWVVEEDEHMEDVVVRGVTINTSEARITVAGVPDRPGIAAEICGVLAKAHINIDMIIQAGSQAGHSDMSFTVTKGDLPKAKEVLAPVVKKLGASSLTADENIAKVSLVGVGMRSHEGVAVRMFSALAGAGINIQMISTSEIKISCVVDGSRAEDALRAVHKAFETEMAAGG